MAKNSVGRPCKKHQSLDELRQQARAGIRRTQARQVGREELDAKELCERIDSITHRNRFTNQELNDIRATVDCLYHEFVREH
jgi:hypothetical protein